MPRKSTADTRRACAQKTSKDVQSGNGGADSANTAALLAGRTVERDDPDASKCEYDDGETTAKGVGKNNEVRSSVRETDSKNARKTALWDIEETAWSASSAVSTLTRRKTTSTL